MKLKLVNKKCKSIIKTVGLLKSYNLGALHRESIEGNEPLIAIWNFTYDDSREVVRFWWDSPEILGKGFSKYTDYCEKKCINMKLINFNSLREEI